MCEQMWVYAQKMVCWIYVKWVIVIFFKKSILFQEQEQLKKLKKGLQKEIEFHKEQVEAHKDAIKRHEERLNELK